MLRAAGHPYLCGWRQRMPDHSSCRPCNCCCRCCRRRHRSHSALATVAAAAAACCSFSEVRKEACFILGLLAVKPEYQHQIAGAQALPGLVKLLTSHSLAGPGASRGNAPSANDGATAATGTAATGRSGSGSGGVARRAADAVTNLAHENLEIKNAVRREGGIPPLVRLLSSWDIKVQRAGAGALRTLAFKNDENKRQIVEEGALPLLIQARSLGAGALCTSWVATCSSSVCMAPTALDSAACGMWQ